jgi:hypothetical protein
MSLQAVNIQLFYALIPIRNGVFMKLFLILFPNFLSFSVFAMGTSWSGHYSLVSDQCFYSNGSSYECSAITHRIPTQIWMRVTVDPQMGDEVLVKYEQIKDEETYNKFNSGPSGEAVKEDLTAPRGAFQDLRVRSCGGDTLACRYNVSATSSTAEIRGPNLDYRYQIEAQGDQMTMTTSLETYPGLKLVRKLVFVRLK